jgi:hypothetical protein
MLYLMTPGVKNIPCDEKCAFSQNVKMRLVPGFAGHGWSQSHYLFYARKKSILTNCFCVSALRKRMTFFEVATLA